MLKMTEIDVIQMETAAPTVMALEIPRCFRVAVATLLSRVSPRPCFGGKYLRSRTWTKFCLP